MPILPLNASKEAQAYQLGLLIGLLRQAEEIISISLVAARKLDVAIVSKNVHHEPEYDPFVHKRVEMQQWLDGTKGLLSHEE